MEKVLVVFHSRSGYTRRIAHALARRLDADLEDVQIVQPMGGFLGYALCAIEALAGLAPALKPATKDAADYDLVLIGTPVWVWSLSSPVRSWIESNRLRRARVAFFCTMGGAGAKHVFATMESLAGKKPVGTLALTDAQVEQDVQGVLDRFVDSLKTQRSAPGARTPKRRRATRSAAAAA